MFLKEFDFLSPPITLFYKGFSSHSSITSGILTIITLAIIIFLSIIQLKKIFKRNDEIPLSTSFTYFAEDVGTISLNSSSLFHFISIENLDNKEKEDFDFTYFNIIGFEYSISDYENNNFNNYDHWLYGFCNNESDIKGNEDITKINYFLKSACIRKYFNSKTQTYYDTYDPNFKWPSSSHGIFNQKNQFYSIIAKPCNQIILNTLFNGEKTCKNIINNSVVSSLAIYINFIDHYIDVLKYEKPIGKYFYRIESKLDGESFFVNQLIFNPSLIRSNKGYFMKSSENEFSLIFERNDYLTYKNNNGIFVAYVFYLNNKVNFYERSYQTIQDCLSNIGGTINIITFIMALINDFVHSYTTLSDLNDLLNKFSISIEDIKFTNKTNKINKKLKKLEKIKKNSNILSKQISSDNIIKEEKIQANQGKKETEEKEPIDNKSINSEKTEVNEDQINANPDTKENLDIDKEKQKESNVFNFFDFFIYKITFGKKKSNFEIYEDFRKQLISVENLFQNYLKINNLLINEKKLEK